MALNCEVKKEYIHIYSDTVHETFTAQMLFVAKLSSLQIIQSLLGNYADLLV